MDFSIIGKAGLTTQDVAFILDVSHVTVWKWQGGTQPRAKAVAKLRLFEAILNKLVEAGKLPKKDLAFSKRMHPEVKAAREAINNKLKQLLAERLAATPANE